MLCAACLFGSVWRNAPRTRRWLAPWRTRTPPMQAACSADRSSPSRAKPLLAIDWSAVSLTSDDDALALWQRIAPTGDDWSDKLDEMPGRLADRRQARARAAPRRQLHVHAIAASGRLCRRRSMFPNRRRTRTSSTRACAGCSRCGRSSSSRTTISRRDATRSRDRRASAAGVAARRRRRSRRSPRPIRIVGSSCSRRAYAAGHRELVNGLARHARRSASDRGARTKHHIDGALDVLSAEAHRAVVPRARSPTRSCIRRHASRRSPSSSRARTSCRPRSAPRSPRRRRVARVQRRRDRRALPRARAASRSSARRARERPSPT